jgi:2-hydroxychromene-2-carboxylate isomerase
MIDYYYTVISGFAYLGEAELARIASRANAPIRYLPVDMARVFDAAGSVAPARQSPARRAYRDCELGRWARRRGLPLNLTPQHRPVPPHDASRAVHAAARLGLDPAPLSAALLRAVWAQDDNIADPAALARIVERTYAAAASSILQAAAGQEVARLYEEATASAISAGVIGSPSYIVDGEMFFGQDRLDFVAAKLGVPS